MALKRELMMTGTVRPIRPLDRVPDGCAPQRPPTCLICGIADPNMARWACDSCKAWMHRECYWGRVAPLEEWRSYVKWNADTDSEIIRTPWEVPSLCPACRASGKEGA